MKISGFSFIRNAVKNDYPIKEAILSVLPLCDEFVVAVGKSEDETLELIQSIASPKIKIIETIWDDSLREGGRTFAQETDKALAAVSKDADWLIYIQGDECIHEKYHQTILDAMHEHQNDTNVEGLLFDYKHFYGSYDYYAVSRRWYRNEIRVLKNVQGLHSYRDAQGFRIDQRKVKVKAINACVYHYGWVKPPKGISHKMKNFNQFYHSQEWVETHFPESHEFDYSNADHLEHFKESHPQVMKERVEKLNWKFSFDPTKQEIKRNVKKRVLHWIEQKFGLRLFEYKNYKIVK